MFNNLKIWLILIVIFPSLSFALEEAFPGARPMGMAGTFVAIADDGNAFNWNPAGLPAIERYEFNSMWYQEKKNGFNPGYLTFITPLQDENMSLGFGWQRLKPYQPDLVERGDWSLAYGQRFKRASLGTKLRCLSLNKPDLTSSIELLVDAGLIYQHSNRLRIGLTKYGLFKTSFEGEGIKSPVSYKIGLAYKWSNKDLLLAADLDNQSLHLGIEHWSSKLKSVPLGLRSGLQLGQGRVSWSVGASLKLQRKLLGFNKYQIDYAYASPTHYLSVSVPFEYLSSLFLIKGMEWNPMFTSLYACNYKTFVDGGLPVGTLTLENKMANETIKVYLRLNMGTYTNNQAQPLSIVDGDKAVSEYYLQPKSTARLRLSRPLIDACILQARVSPFSPRLEINYTLHQQSNQRLPPSPQATIYGQRGGSNTYQIDWNSPEMLSAFMTTHNQSLVAKFIDQVDKSYLRIQSSYTIPKQREDFFKALFIFEALNAYGLKYEGETAPLDRLDRDNSLTYPDEILKMGTKTADCEEIALLYASCLKRWGIPVSFLEAGPAKKRHLLVMLEFNEEDMDKEFINQTIISNPEWGEGFYLPIEVSRIGVSFMEACCSGIELYRAPKYKQAKRIPLNDLFVYSLPLSDSGGVVFTDELEGQIDKLFQDEFERFKGNQIYNRFLF